MSLTKLWGDFALQLHAATAQSAGAVNLTGIVEQGLSFELVSAVDRADGSVFSSFGYLKAGRPMARFASLDLATVLDNISESLGMLIDKDGTHPGVTMYFQKAALGGTRTPNATTEHVAAVFENGLILARSVELSHSEPARVACEIMPVAAGAVDPVTMNEAAALPVGLDPTITAEWTLGKVDLNGTQLEGVSSVTIDFGIDAQVEARDSDIFPSFVWIRSVSPTVTIRGNHVDILATLTEKGLEYAEGQVVLYARKRDEGGEYVADGTAEHIAFTLGQCRVDPMGVSGDPKELTIRITPWKDTANPITVDTTAAIV